jgi:S-methylmethionine-dependent homocysteine/selenocysteine methylase
LQVAAAEAALTFSEQADVSNTWEQWEKREGNRGELVVMDGGYGTELERLGATMVRAYGRSHQF